MSHLLIRMSRLKGIIIFALFVKQILYGMMDAVTMKSLVRIFVVKNIFISVRLSAGAKQPKKK